MHRVTNTIASHMTVQPHTIGRDQPLSHAHDLMRRHGFRHLPVLDGGAVVGVVTARDLAIVEALRDVTPETVTVEEAMTPTPYAVGPSESLAIVCWTMAEHHYGCAIVVDEGRVLGIFTTTDALRMLAAKLPRD